MGALNFDISNIAHPGTPIQIIIAIASRIAFIISDNKSVVHDVVQDPEKYIFASNLLYNIIFAFIIGMIGYKTTKYTGDIRMGLLLQLGFFANMNLLTVSGRLLPEAFMFMPLGLILLLMIKYLYDAEREKKWRAYIIQFSLLIGWGVATKLSFAPFFLMPLIIIPGLKRKAALTGLSIVAFLIIAFPVTLHLNQFWDWTRDMLIHSGKWGKGEANFADFSKFPERIAALYKMDRLVFILLVLLLFESFILAFINRKIKFLKTYLNVTFSSIGAIMILLFLICKHYTGHYFFPVMLFKSFLLFLIIYPSFHWLKLKKIQPYLKSAVLLIALVLMFLSLHNLGESYFSKKKEHQLERLVNFRSKVSAEDILIISSHYSGAPFKEQALSGGLLTSGSAHKIFKKPFRQQYPNSYMYYSWTDKFFKSYTYFSSQELVKKNKPIYIYIGRGQDKDLEVIRGRFQEKNPDMNFKFVKIVDDPKAGDKLYRLKISEER